MSNLETSEVGVLYIVATPIGNLEDLSLRARNVLGSVAFVAAEDTRRSRILLNHVGHPEKPIRRLDANSTEEQVESLLGEVTVGGSLAVVTDAGTPSVSDPGALVVRVARARGWKVVPIPGASAVVTALSASGYATSAFLFLGFLPRGGNERAQALARIAQAQEAIILFEAPPRMAETLLDLARIQPLRRALIARELTKLHEELSEGPLGELAESLANKDWLGELTVVLEPYSLERGQLDEQAVTELVDQALASGLRARDVAERLTVETGWAKRDLYQLTLSRKNLPRR